MRTPIVIGDCIFLGENVPIIWEDGILHFFLTTGVYLV